MAVKTKDEILKQIKERIGDDTSDTALQLIEDVNDTLDSLTASADSEDWKTKYEQNDADWRKRYRDRFFNVGADDEYDNPDPNEEPKVEHKNPVSFEELFTKE